MGVEACCYLSVASPLPHLLWPRVMVACSMRGMVACAVWMCIAGESMRDAGVDGAVRGQRGRLTCRCKPRSTSRGCTNGRSPSPASTRPCRCLPFSLYRHLPRALPRIPNRHAGPATLSSKAATYVTYSRLPRTHRPHRRAAAGRAAPTCLLLGTMAVPPIRRSALVRCLAY